MAVDPGQARSARIEAAIEAGLALPAAGPVAVFRPRRGDLLASLDPQRLCIVTGFRPDHDAFAAMGLDVRREAAAGCAAAIVCLPPSRDSARDLIARAVAVTDGPVVVDGQKTDGIAAMLRAVRADVAVAGTVSRAHGKLFWFSGAEAGVLSSWRAVPQRVAAGFVTVPGVFSADGPDPASQLLAAALPARLDGVIADLGAGWGWLSAQVLARDGVEELHLVEAEADALDCARRNLDDPRVRLHWADVAQFDAPRPFDAVVMNPPFHAGRAGDPGLGRSFIAAAARILGPRGVLWMVANRHLPYEGALAEGFAEVAELPGSSAFKLFRAARPRRKRGGAAARTGAGMARINGNG